ncbi:unnamed protein product, partial [Musa hybrid cultivar]
FHGSLGPVDISECDSVDREGCADDLVGEEKGAERRGARRQSAFIFLEPHRPVRSCSTQKQSRRNTASSPLHRHHAAASLHATYHVSVHHYRAACAVPPIGRQTGSD